LRNQFCFLCFFLDTQNCTLKFGSWTYDDAGINLTVESNQGQLDAYRPNAEWDLQGFTTNSNHFNSLFIFVLNLLKIFLVRLMH